MLNSIKVEINFPSKFIDEQWQTLEAAIQSFRSFDSDKTKERLAENLMIITARYLSSLLYERALLKLKIRMLWKDGRRTVKRM